MGILSAMPVNVEKMIKGTAKSWHSRLNLAIKEGAEWKVLVTILLPFFFAHIFLAIFWDTTTDYDALWHAKGAKWLAGLPLHEWFPIVGDPGLVWLPGYKWSVASLYLLTGIDTLYLGQCVSAASNTGTALYVYLFLTRLAKKPKEHGILGIGVLGLTPYWVLLGTQCMMEALGFFLLMAGVYHTLHSVYQVEQWPFHFLLAIVFLSLANLTRYEPWVLTTGLLAFLFFQNLTVLSRQQNPRNSVELRRIALIFMLGVVTITVIIMWLYQNYRLTGDWFYANAWIGERIRAENWGAARTTYGRPEYAVEYVYWRVWIAAPFWWAIPVVLLLAQNYPLFNRLQADDFLVKMVMGFLLGIFLSFYLILAYKGMSTSAIRQYTVVAPMAAISMTLFYSDHLAHSQRGRIIFWGLMFLALIWTATVLWDQRHQHNIMVREGHPIPPNSIPQSSS